jgi:hypothetical protein
MTKLEFIVSLVCLAVVGPAWFWSVDILTFYTPNTVEWKLALAVFGGCCILMAGLVIYHMELVVEHCNGRNNNVPF